MVSRLDFESFPISIKTNVCVLYHFSAILPQIKTCHPSVYDYLNKEITENNFGLDVKKVKALVTIFKKAYYCFGVTCEQIHGNDHAECVDLHRNAIAGFNPVSDVYLVRRLGFEPFPISIKTNVCILYHFPAISVGSRCVENRCAIV